MSKILNFGSLNIDHVYRLDRIVAPGETLASSAYQIFAGGKGANQSAAIAAAGGEVFHAGRIGPEGSWLLQKLADLGVDMRFTQEGDLPTGHAVIQVDAQGQNAILLYAGANKALTRRQIDTTLGHFAPGHVLLLQNETNELPYLIEQAAHSGFKVCLNPAPYGPEVAAYPLDGVDCLVVNQTEGQGLSGQSEPEAILDALSARWRRAALVLTLGPDGVRYRDQTADLCLDAPRVEAVDTTAAGDTFIGYFLAAVAADVPPQAALQRAVYAAALSVTRPGAMDSIPAGDEVDAFAATQDRG